jgi:hypothetical protein
VIVGVRVIVGVGVTVGLGVSVGVRVRVCVAVAVGEGGIEVRVAGGVIAAASARGSEIDKLLQPDSATNRIAYSPVILFDRLVDLIFTTPPTLRGESVRLYIQLKEFSLGH